MNTEQTTQHDQDFAEAREVQWMWKSPAMEAMAVAICTLALERGVAGEFSALDLPIHTAAQHGGRGIAGAVFHRLAKDDVLSPVGSFVGPAFMLKFVTNTGGNPVRVWRLKSPARAARLVSIHGGRKTEEFKQTEMAV